jgi:hypothetical protein
MRIGCPLLAAVFKSRGYQKTRAAVLTPCGVRVIVNVRLMLVLPVWVLMRRVGVLQPGVVVVMCVDCGQVFHLPAGSALTVMRYVNVLVAVHSLFVRMALETLYHCDLRFFACARRLMPADRFGKAAGQRLS